MGDFGWIGDLVALCGHELLLFAAIAFLIGGIDDLAVDLLWFREWLRGRLKAPDAARLPPPPPLAIFVPAWDEGDVIGAMLRHMTGALSEGDLRIFVGAYPNDRPTIDAVAAIAEADPRIVLVLRDRPGPTTKADCLNALWRAMLRDEGLNARRFTGVVLHDAEDVVHPLEPRVLGHMLVTHQAVQLPVHPLVMPGSPLVSGHYADEFSEAHRKLLPVRQSLGAALPLAGVGCAIRRDMLAAIADRRGGDPFDADSLTEDYELGLLVSRAGGTVGFARMTDEAGALVAVRGYFPATINAAVRQKARWMAGIALAGWDRTGWGGRASPVEWWMRMRDRRALLAVFALAAAYVGLLAHALGWMIGGTAFSRGAAFDTLLLVTSALLLWRVAMRMLCVGRSYGGRAALLAPARLFVGNVIAMFAARRALWHYLRLLRGETPRWDKTAHHFPPVLDIPR